MPSSLLHTKIEEIDSEDVLELLHELEMITGFHRREFARSSLFLYLTTCLLRNGSKIVKITRTEIDSFDPSSSFLLRKKLKQLSGSPIFAICDEIVRDHNNVLLNESAEVYDNTCLYHFLNSKLPNPYQKKKKVPSRFF